MTSEALIDKNNKYGKIGDLYEYISFAGDWIEYKGWINETDCRNG